MSGVETARGVTLVLGGARSGKSAFAEGLVRESARPRIYLATATAGDAEMAARIARHRQDRNQDRGQDRDGDWRTIEEPLAIADIIVGEAQAGRAVLVDCLTLWLSNLMEAARDIAAESARLTDALAAARQTRGGVVLVSNEIGLGLVPDTRLGRDFRDAQGRLNQAVAQAADGVVFVAAGLPLWLKQPVLRTSGD